MFHHKRIISYGLLLWTVYFNTTEKNEYACFQFKIRWIVIRYTRRVLHKIDAKLNLEGKKKEKRKKEKKKKEN